MGGASARFGGAGGKTVEVREETVGRGIRGAIILALALAVWPTAFDPPASAQTAVKTPVQPFCARAKFKLAIDIGHSPKIGGAVSARGVDEYVFNKRLAEEVYIALREAGFSRAFMINEYGGEMTLGQRVRAARRKEADLFLSIHHDSVLPQFLKNGPVEGVEREYTDYARGYSIFVTDERETGTRSLAAARLLGNALRTAGLKPSTHHGEPIKGASKKLLDKHAGVYAYPRLVVLKFTESPALLFEGGVIKNPADEVLMNQPDHRQKLVAAIVAMAEAYCD